PERRRGPRPGQDRARQGRERDVRRVRERPSEAAPPEGRDAIRTLRVVLLGALLAPAACRCDAKQPATHEGPTSPAPPTSPDAAAVDGGGAGQLLAYPAIRCAECHDK